MCIRDSIRDSAYKKVAEDAVFAGIEIGGFKNAERAFNGKSKEEIGKLPEEVFNKAGEHMAEYYTPYILGARVETAGMSEKTRDAVIANINKEINRAEKDEKRKKAYNKQWQTWTERNTVGNKFAFDFSQNEESGFGDDSIASVRLTTV